jgi:hypothetical protein
VSDRYVPTAGGRAALRELARVPWSTLLHANGRGGAPERPGINPFTKRAVVIKAVPSPEVFLRDLASDDAPTREAAHELIEWILVYEGVAFEATAAAVPFLAALAAGDDCPDRTRVVKDLLLMLAACADVEDFDSCDEADARSKTWEAFQASRAWLEAAKELGAARERAVIQAALGILDGARSSEASRRVWELL